ncbi:MAG: pyridoxamine 5'-phosphate oxidase family protein [Bacteroidetes bacterium]|nr:MAG: pyridoxamine 5'-phosphate oxidase family protein [Bacteroidota bacterium]
MSEYPRTDRNRVRRLPKRGHYDQETIFSILDDGFVAHVGFCLDGQPFVIPTLYGRKEDRLYLHGAATSRMLQALQQGIPVCLTVTHVDGLVLARSLFNHSVNYRSVVVFGTATLVPDEDKTTALRIISEHVVPHRWEEARQPNDKELKATAIVEVVIEEASAKIRTGPAGDEPEDLSLPVWAGVVPLRLQYGPPEPDASLDPRMPLPQSVERLIDGK